MPRQIPLQFKELGVGGDAGVGYKKLGGTSAALEKIANSLKHTLGKLRFS